jgi:sec-independent protein translocase protein TatA
MPFNLGPGELLLILAIALVVLGPKKLPEAGRSLGKGLREFKDSVSGSHTDETHSLTVSSDLSAFEQSEKQKVA